MTDKSQVVTFGCRLNAYESEVIRGQLPPNDNTIVFNTCAVTAEAERQARQAVRRVRREKPEARIVVTGCAAQVQPDTWHSMPEVDAVVGNDEKLMRGVFDRSRPDIQVSNIMEVAETAGHLIDGFEARTRAFLQIQNGCNHRCTFCIIPYARGNSRSIAARDVVEKARKLVSNGFREIVLTGVDIGDYGRDLCGCPSLARLIEMIFDQIPNLTRLRLSSIDPIELNSELIDLLANEKRLMPHLHLSVQSGDDLILKRMKRRHSRSDVVEICRILRQLRPDILYGADLIAGFPTETESNFNNTLNLIEECRFSFLHVFPYSSRSGTPAARMPQLPSAIRKKRAKLLRDKGRVMAEKVFQCLIGSRQAVLAESNANGRTEHFVPIAFNKPVEAGTVVSVDVVGVSENGLVGTLSGD